MDVLTHSVEQALQTLRKGGLILYPTDTVWGIGCDATNAAAVQKVYALKQRDDKKSLIILLADEKDILRYVSAPPPEAAAYLNHTDRPTTVIYEGALGLPDNLVQDDGSIAIRIVKEPFCKALIRRLRKPIVSTSANISGEPTPPDFKTISAAIKAGVDYIVPYRQEESREAIPSRIVRFGRHGELQVLRP